MYTYKQSIQDTNKKILKQKEIDAQIQKINKLSVLIAESMDDDSIKVNTFFL